MATINRWPTLAFLDGRYVNVTGDAMTGALSITVDDANALLVQDSQLTEIFNVKTDDPPIVTIQTNLTIDENANLATTGTGRFDSGLVDSSSVLTVDIENNQLIDSSISQLKYDWLNDNIYEGGGNVVFNIGGAELNDLSATKAISLNSRLLCADDGSDVILDYSTVGTAGFGNTNLITTGNILLNSTSSLLQFANVAEKIWSPSAGVIASESRGNFQLYSDSNANDGNPPLSIYTNNTQASGTATLLWRITHLGDVTMLGDLTVTGGNVGVGTAAQSGVGMTIEIPQVQVWKGTNTAASGSGNGAGMQGLQDDGAAMALGDRLGFYTLGGARDASNNTSNAVAYTGFATENWGSTNTGAELRLETTPNGSTSRVARVVIGQDGSVKSNASRINRITRETASTTLDATDEIVMADSDGGDITITLPPGIAGLHYRIANTGSSGNKVTIDGNAAETVLGQLTQILDDGEILNIYYETTEKWW